MNVGNFIYDSPAIDFNIEQDTQNIPRPSVLLESRKDKYRNYYKSKWANLKLFLQDKSSLEASIDLLKTKTVEQFSFKCREIYQKKIEIQLMKEKNRKLIRQGVKSIDFSNYGEQYEVTDGISGLPTESIQTFMFMFRENNELMLKLIENIDSKKIEILVPFLCHFFYENFYTENMEQDEIIYLVYLLLEKEIDKLILPSEQVFLDENFLAQFLKEMGCRYEIKNYIDIILNDLICFLEESHLSYYSLDLNDDFINNLIVQEKSNKTNIKQSTMFEATQTFTEKKNKPKDFIKRSVGVFGFKNNNSSLINDLPKDANFDCSQNTLTELYFKEKNDDVKQFLFKHLKKIRADKNPSLYDCSRIKDYLKRKGKILKETVITYTNGYNMITKFIEDLLKELENDTIVPYSIRLICLFIKVLIQKKFKSVSNFEANNFVARFLFDKLLFPVLINPERCDIGKDRLISLPTRKNLFNIYLIMKNLVKGELFNAEKNPNLVIFNKFIIDNYHKVSDIIKKMIDVKMPKKLEILSKDFYSEGNKLNRTEDSINYKYFEENPNDFMQHKSICFTINELNMFYEIVNTNKEKFLIPGSKFKETFETLSNFISMIKGKPNHYYVIISDYYKQETKELLFHKDTTKPLGTGKTKEEIIENIHYCIKFLINNLEILPHWEWVCENYKTLDTFKFINQYLNSYEGVYNFYPGSVPLNWYSLYIINNLESIKPEDAINDYQALYDEIESQILQQHKKLSKLNEFLTVNMTSKFILIDNKIKIYQEELKNVKNTYINVKTLQLMYSKEIIAYLSMVSELTIYGIQLESIDDVTGFNNLIFQTEAVIFDKNPGKKKYEIPKEKMCTNINEFISKLVYYYQFFFDELKSISFMEPISKKNIRSMSSVLDAIQCNPETKMKETIDSYLQYVKDIFINEGLFKEKTVVSCDNNNNEINLEKNDNCNLIEEEKSLSAEEFAVKSIKNFIFKTLCLHILSNNNNIFNEDIKFNQRCNELKNITIEDLKIPEELYDSNIFEKIISHVKRMDDLRTPEDMLKEFELAIQLINSLFMFMLDKKETGNDDFTSVILYIIIKALPIRMYFNFKFIIYFFDEKDKKGKNDYIITQAKTCLNYIMNELKIDTSKKMEKPKNNNNIDKEGETPAPTPF